MLECLIFFKLIVPVDFQEDRCDDQDDDTNHHGFELFNHQENRYRREHQLPYDTDDDIDSVPVINYCLIQGLSGIVHTGGENFDAKPWFTAPVDPASAPTTTGDYTLGIFSPAIDVGDNAANGTPTDLAGGPRIINSIIDLGAYEAPYVQIYRTYLPVVLRNYP